jgi:5-methylcytosine-specific restriction protein A
MPDAAPHWCVIPGCGVLTTRRRCPAHHVQAEQSRTNWEIRRWYRTPRWKALRLRLLRACGYQCSDCRTITPSLEVHHVTKHEADPVRFWDPANLIVLCRACHQRKTQRGE